MAYVRFLIVGGNLARNNIMQIRILPAGGQRAGAQSPHMIYASFVAGPAPSAFTAAPGAASLIAGIACPVGQGAQCEIPVANPAPAPPPCVAPCVGHVESLQGQLQIKRGNTTIALKAGDQINLNDVIQTGDGSAAELSFLDDTQFKLGEKTKVTIDEYVYSPDKHSGAVYQLLEGAFKYVSSKIGKHDTDSRIETAYGTIGIRGTEFVAHEDSAGQDEIDLIRGQLDIKPKALTQATTFTGPVKILLNQNSSTGSPLSQAEYDASQARLSPAQCGAPVL